MEFRLENWSGGVTDYYVNAQPNQSQKMDNLLIDRNAKPYIRSGSAVEDIDFPLTPLGNQRISRLLGFRRRDGSFNYFKVIGRRVFQYTGSGHVEVTGVSGRPFFTAGTLNSHISYDEWNDHIIATVNENSGVYAYPTLGYFPDNDTTPTGINCGFKRPTNVTTSSTGTDNLYTYALHYSYTYMVDDVEFVMRGAVELAQCTSDLMDGSASITLNFDAFDISSLTANFDVTNIDLRIFRTVANGTVQYWVADLTAASTTYVDTTADDDILDTEFVYITGGVVDYEPLPLAKYCTIVNGTGYFANFKDLESSTNAWTYRIQQSIQGLPYVTNGSFYVDVDGEITGLNRFNSYPIVTTLTRLYRLEGAFNTDGTGYIRAKEIGSTTGCVSNNSIVRTPDGLYFAGVDGFYWTNGQDVRKISRHIDKSYPQYVRSQEARLAIQGQLDEVSGRIYWTVSSGTFGNECDKIIVLDPYWGVSDTMTITTLSGGSNWTCSSILFDKANWYRSSINGYTYVHTDDTYTDPIEDVANDAEDWANESVLYDWSSAALNFGTDVQRKWTTQIVATFKNETNISVQPWSCNDASDDWRAMKQIRYRGNLVWGQSDFIWGSVDFVWRDTGNIIAKRMFTTGTLRCTHKQVKFTNALAVIIRSDDYVPAIVNAASKTFLMANYPADTWPTDVVGYFIRSEHNGYVTNYRIASRTDDTLIVEDPSGNLQSGTWKWEIVGYRKGEKFALDAVTINYAMFGDSQTAFQKSDEGGNA